MKNRIFWVIEQDRAWRETAPGQVPEELDAAHSPWSIFGKLGQSERDALRRIYEAGLRAAESGGDSTPVEGRASDNSFATQARFRRLVADLEEADIYGDSSP